MCPEYPPTRLPAVCTIRLHFGGFQSSQPQGLAGEPTVPSSSSFLTCSAFLPVSGVKNNVYDASFDETFIVFVHGANVELAQHETNDEKVC